MKKMIICILSLFLTVLSGGSVNAEDSQSLQWGMPKVDVTFLDETVNVLDGILEMQSDVQEQIYFDVEFEGYNVPPVFTVVQMKDGTVREMITSHENSFSFSADQLVAEWPVYLIVADGRDNQVIGVELLGIRVRKNAILSKVPEDLGSEFGKGISLNMDYLLPGMELDVLPFLIPVTVKTYGDGTIRIGLGTNSSDQEFWEKAAMGEMPEGQLASDLKDIFYSDKRNLDGISKPESMGVVVMFSGWAEGNVNTTEPILGQMQLYIGTGFSINAQYAIFTFNLSLSGGATGKFDFHFEYVPEDSDYHFNTDHVLAGVKGALEVFGGIGCSLASIGVYGAGSIEYQQEMYPDPEAEHLIVAGELGLKAKLFGKVLACLKIVSGSHDLAEDMKKKVNVLGAQLTSEEFRDYLLSSNYGDTQGVLLKGGESMKWHGSDIEVPDVSNDWESESDFSHLLAEDIYPDNHVQLANTGSSALPEMTMVFLGSDSSRKEGNRSLLKTGYYKISTQFVSDPVSLHDDGTADFEPFLYENKEGSAYLVWKNAVEELRADMSFSEIAEKTDIWFSEHGTANYWANPERITAYAGSDIFAAGAKVCDENGSPAVYYYTNDVKDPAGLSGTHEIYVSRRKGADNWEARKVAEASGSINQLDGAYFGAGLCTAVSYESDGTSKIEVYRDNEKIFEKENAANGRFVRAGNSTVYFTWFENGAIYKRDTAGNESRLTPENIIIPKDAYEISGHIGCDALLITSVSAKDTHGDAFAYISYDGGITWSRSDLTRIGANSYVSHLAACFTYEGEPVILYSVQNYETNVSLASEALQAKEDEGMAVMLGEEDERFTDTTTDLYIKARAANSHIRFESGKALDTDTLLPGKPVRFSLRFRNTGLYDIEHADIYCNGEKAGEYDGKLGLWETAEVIVETTIPSDPQQILTYTFEIHSRDDGLADSRISVEVDPGYLEVKTWHSLRHGEEQIRYQIVNHGYLRKNARMLIRDEAREVVLDEWTVPYDAGEKRDSEFRARGGLFVNQGCENVTLYVLLDGEEPGDEGISLNRIQSIVPLEEIYGQPYDHLTDHEMMNRKNSSPSQNITYIALAAAFLGAAAGVLYYRRRKKNPKTQS